jgi:hypothetical protein
VGGWFPCSYKKPKTRFKKLQGFGEWSEIWESIYHWIGNSVVHMGKIVTSGVRGYFKGVRVEKPAKFCETGFVGAFIFRISINKNSVICMNV